MVFDRRGGAFLVSLFVLGALTLRADAASTVTGLTVALHARHAPAIVLHHRDRFATSSNWSGYAVTGAAGSVTDVQGSWIVPAVTCSGGPNQYVAVWVGIDGFNSNTVEQTGTDSDCQNGAPTYYAWFEFYPHPAFLINNFPVRPNDMMSADVRYDPSRQRFTVTLVNHSTGQTFSTSTKVGNARRSSAEWIVEAPSGGGILPLANFGTASLGQDYTGIGPTSYATVSGTTGPIGAFNSNVAITMLGNGGATKASPSPLTSDGTSFTDTWDSAGP